MSCNSSVICVLSQDGRKPSELQRSFDTQWPDPKSTEKSCVSDNLKKTKQNNNLNPCLNIVSLLKFTLIFLSYRAIWNDLTDSESLCIKRSITVNFTDEDLWEEWGAWVFKRCEVSNNEKLLMVLHKVCNISVHCLEVQWAKTFYKKLSQLIKCRIECCTEDDICKKLKKYENILNHWKTEMYTSLRL